VRRVLARLFFLLSGGRPMERDRTEYAIEFLDGISGEMVRCWVDRDRGRRWMALGPWSGYRIERPADGPPVAAGGGA